MNMTKRDLSRAVARKTGLELKIMTPCVNALWDCIEDYLVEGHTIVIKNFGRFKVRLISERKVNNLHQEGKTTVPAHWKAVFLPGGYLKYRMNEAGKKDVR